MRFLRDVNASILRARFSLSAVSSSTELEAVLTSMPSFLRRSMTSWLERLRSLASWKTLTFPIRLPSLALARCRALAHRRRLAFRGRRLHGRRRFRRRFPGRGRRLGVGGRLLLGLPARFFLGRRLLGRQPLRLLAGGFLGVAAVPLLLGGGRRLADLLGRLLPDALDARQLLVGLPEEVLEAAPAP